MNPIQVFLPHRVKLVELLEGSSQVLVQDQLEDDLDVCHIRWGLLVLEAWTGYRGKLAAHELGHVFGCIVGLALLGGVLASSIGFQQQIIPEVVLLRNIPVLKRGRII